MIKAIIVDDEKSCIRKLELLIGQFLADRVQLVGVFETVESGISGLRELRPELVFLDVQIGDRMGFELLMETRDIPCAVIFATAYDQYALQAFKFSAVDYLVKPIAAQELVEAVGKLDKKLSGEERSRKLENLLYNLTDTNIGQKRICVPVADGFLFLQVGDIKRCESKSNYTIFFMKDGQKLIVSRTLKEFEALLIPYRFFRVHHSHLVNMFYIKSYHRGKGGSVTLSDNTVIEVSTRRKDEFLKRLTEI